MAEININDNKPKKTIKYTSKYIDKLKEKVALLPKSPGVYIMKNEVGQIIYIGKAKSLKNRVSSYFQADTRHTEKTKLLVKNIQDFEYIMTDTELEALILECSMIKQHKPRYNILLKDDKQYPWIKATVNDQFPRLIMVRRRQNDKAKYFGPYSSAYSIHQILNTVQQVFKLPACKRDYTMPNSRPCLNNHIGRCSAPCMGGENLTQYSESFTDIIKFLSGNYTDVCNSMKEKMEKAADNERFERAAAYRDQIRAVELLGEKQKVTTGPDVSMDVFSLFINETGACMQVFNIRSGIICDKDSNFYPLSETEDESQFYSDFIKQYYLARQDIPDTVLTQSHPTDTEVISEMLSKIKSHGKKVRFKVAKTGELFSLMNMVKENAKQSLIEYEEKEFKNERRLVELAEILDMGVVPTRIEAFDIANTAEFGTVASMVVFENGLPLKNMYRSFNIKGNIEYDYDGNKIAKQDDYASMEEVLARRFSRLDANDKGFEVAPDLILVDGGAGHLSVALRVLNEFGYIKSITAAGMFKDNRHRTKGLVFRKDITTLCDDDDIDYNVISVNSHHKYSEINLNEHRDALHMVYTIQEEAHRFANKHHNIQRRKTITTLQLEEIPGIGKQRAANLLKHFKSVNKIKSASLDELSEVKGMTREAAMSVQLYYETII